jgi:hypothetical protein
VEIGLLSDRQIADVVRRYREKGLTEGGPWSLAELLMEQRRRIRSELPTVGVARKIVELSSKSPDGLTTYKDIWSAFRPGEAWIGNKSQQTVASALARVVAYCVRNGLPILTVLVVQSASRRLSPEAVANIYNEARELGVPAGLDAGAFIEDQRARAREIAAIQLVDDPLAD